MKGIIDILFGLLFILMFLFAGYLVYEGISTNNNDQKIRGILFFLWTCYCSSSMMKYLMWKYLK